VVGLDLDRAVARGEGVPAAAEREERAAGVELDCAAARGRRIGVAAKPEQRVSETDMGHRVAGI